MPPPIPNPSIYVLTIPNSASVETVDAELAALTRAEGGSVLTALGGSRYAVSRPLVRRLRRQAGEGAVRSALSRPGGVTRVRRLRADEVVSLYATRDELEPGAPTLPIETPPDPIQRSLRVVNLDAVRASMTAENFAALALIRAGHIDTGYTVHSAFGPWDQGTNEHIRSDLGVDYLDGGDPLDPMNYTGQPGHGTRTMSVLAGNDPDTYIGAAGGVTVVPYRVTRSVIINGTFQPVNVGAAITHAVRENGCGVISISLGDPCFPDVEMGRAVDMAYESGVIVVAAAGNVTSEVVYPGKYSRTICAGGVTLDGKPWAGASRGPRVDLSAPAEGVWTARWRRPRRGTTPDRFTETYGQGSGTSYATTHLSGVAALWLALRGGEIENRYPEPWQKVEAFRLLAKQTARVPPEWNSDFGAGILDAEALVAAQLPSPDQLRFEPDLATNDIG